MFKSKSEIINNEIPIALTQSRVQPLNGSEPDSYRILKVGIWIYFLLLIFEGSLRKWILPGLATPLLVVRDPVALWLLFYSWKNGLLLPNLYLTGAMWIGIVCVFTAIFFGHGNLQVAIYGARTLTLHFPLVFVIGKIFNRDDILKMGKVVLWMSIPMVVLISLQFYSPQSALVNRGVGGDIAGAGFSGALGFFRPPGTFSFTNGNTFFFSLLNVFVIYFLLNTKSVHKILLACATVALIIAIPLSISRALFFQVAMTLVFLFIGIGRKPKYLAKMIMGAAIALLLFAALNQTTFYQTATAAFMDRFDTASGQEGGLHGTLIDRYFGGMVHAIEKSADMPFFGYGIGMGTNGGSMLLAGRRSFLIAEEEWERNIGELGPLLGLCVIFFRVGFSARIALAGYRRMRNGDLLPWLLLSFGLLIIPQGQWAQPTALGFSVLIGGLIVAALRIEKKVIYEHMSQENGY